MFELSDESRRITFEDIDQRPVPSLMRGFSAPVNLETSLSDDDLLVACSRMTATCSIGGKRRRPARRAGCFARWRSTRNGGAAGDASKFAAALDAVLARYETDPAFTAQAVILPSESDLARDIGQNVDPDAIYRARKALRSQIGRARDAVARSL